MQQIRTTAFEMNNTVENLLFISQVRTMEIPLDAVDMGMVTARIRRRLDFLVREYQGTIIVPDAWPSAIGYSPWIEEVWANYISNAIKFGGRPPVVRLGTTSQPGGMISFWVLDNGFGIPLEIQEKLFVPFSHVDKNCRSGHGLGLSIVRHIIERLGGKVGVESKAGKGSLFYFTLPASPSIEEYPRIT